MSVIGCSCTSRSDLPLAGVRVSMHIMPARVYHFTKTQFVQVYLHSSLRDVVAVNFIMGHRALSAQVTFLVSSPHYMHIRITLF